MEDRDPVSETRAKTSDRLRRQRDLRHEDDRAAAALQCCGTRLQVDLGLSAAGRPVKEDVLAFRRVERGDDAIDSRALRVAEPSGCVLAGECIPLRRLRTLAPRLSPQRCDEGKRASRRRAVVIGDPQRELDELAGQLIHDALDGRDLHTLWRRNVERGHDSAPPDVAETNLDNRASSHIVRHLVGELTREGARRHERIDGSEAGHTCSVW